MAALVLQSPTHHRPFTNGSSNTNNSLCIGDDHFHTSDEDEHDSLHSTVPSSHSNDNIISCDGDPDGNIDRLSANDDGSLGGKVDNRRQHSSDSCSSNGSTDSSSSGTGSNDSSLETENTSEDSDIHLKSITNTTDTNKKSDSTEIKAPGFESSAEEPEERVVEEEGEEEPIPHDFYRGSPLRYVTTTITTTTTTKLVPDSRYNKIKRYGADTNSHANTGMVNRKNFPAFGFPNLPHPQHHHNNCNYGAVRDQYAPPSSYYNNNSTEDFQQDYSSMAQDDPNLTLSPPYSCYYDHGTVCYVPAVMQYYEQDSSPHARLRTIASCARAAVQNYYNTHKDWPWIGDTTNATPTNTNSTHNSNTHRTQHKVSTTEPDLPTSARSSFSDSAFEESVSLASSLSSSNLSSNPWAYGNAYVSRPGKKVMSYHQHPGSNTNPYNAIKQQGKAPNQKHAIAKRCWINLDSEGDNNCPQRRSPLEHNSDEFTVMCYNVLSEKYATGNIYGYCPDWALRWSYRKFKILEEIYKYGADIICLQEVEYEQFHSFFTPKLRKIGLSGIFYPKSRWSYYNDAERKTVDGCCIFYRTNRFNLVCEKMVELNKLPLVQNGLATTDPLIHRLTNRDNIAIMALFEQRNTGIGAGDKKYLALSTAHFFWDPAFSDVKILQSMIFIDAMKKFVNETCHKLSIHKESRKKSAISNIPLIVCGDFNSLPESGAVEYLKNGRIKWTHPELLKMGPLMTEMLDDYNNGGCNVGDKDKKAHPRFTSHNLKLVTPYTDNVLPFTNYTPDFSGSIDHMFHSDTFLKATRILGPIDAQWFKNNRFWGAPNPAMPSDHIPLVTSYKFLPKTFVLSPFPSPISSQKSKPTTMVVSAKGHDHGGDHDKMLYSSLFKRDSASDSPSVPNTEGSSNSKSEANVTKQPQQPLALRVRAVSQSEIKLSPRRGGNNNNNVGAVAHRSKQVQEATVPPKGKGNTDIDDGTEPQQIKPKTAVKGESGLGDLPKNTIRRKKNRRAAAKKNMDQQQLLLKLHLSQRQNGSDSTLPNSMCSSSLASSSVSLDRTSSADELTRLNFGQNCPSSDEDDYSNYYSVGSTYQSETDDIL